jgi:hypothetical protein
MLDIRLRVIDTTWRCIFILMELTYWRTFVVEVVLVLIASTLPRLSSSILLGLITWGVPFHLPNCRPNDEMYNIGSSW